MIFIIVSVIKLADYELYLVLNVLNEVCGFKIDFL